MMEHPPNAHFYASSIAMWATTTPKRDLFELIKLMKKDGHGFGLYLVPLPYDANYEIKMYQPQVEGTQWLGYFPKRGSK